MGCHIKAKRLGLGLTQKEVGEITGAGEFTVLNWEKH